jgi:hypothetical protein
MKSLGPGSKELKFAGVDPVFVENCWEFSTSCGDGEAWTDGVEGTFSATPGTNLLGASSLNVHSLLRCRQTLQLASPLSIMHRVLRRRQRSHGRLLRCAGCLRL